MWLAGFPPTMAGMATESRSVPERTATTPTAPSGRVSALDVLRGFALCGILVVNVQPIANAGARVLDDTGTSTQWPGLLFDQRFFPIFSLLFGIGFALLLRSAGQRVARPRVVLLRRLLVLLAVGLAHHLLLWQGDILTVYAVVGLAVLLPLSFAPRWLTAALAVPVLAAGLLVGTGFFSLIPGLFLVGAALTRYGVVDRLDRARLAPWLLLLAFAAATAPVLYVQVTNGGPRAFALAGLLTAGQRSPAGGRWSRSTPGSSSRCASVRPGHAGSRSTNCAVRSAVIPTPAAPASSPSAPSPTNTQSAGRTPSRSAASR